MARSQIRQSEALRRARERQRELDRQEDEAREAARARIADASAAAIVALERRAEAERTLATATSAAGNAVRALLAEDVEVDRAAALLDMSETDVRRLVKAAAPEQADREARTTPSRSPSSGGAAPVTPLGDGGAVP